MSSSYSTTVFALILLAGAIIIIIYRCSSNGGGRKLLPPGPRPLPLIGNLQMLGNLPHRNLQHLSMKYGPIMSLRLGSIPTIVVSSPEAAELFLKTHDTVFASRPKVQASDYLSYGAKGVAFAQYGAYWRSARKLCTIELLTAAKIDSYGVMRKEEISAAVKSIRAAPPGEVVDVSEIVERTVEHMTYRMVFGRRSDESVDLMDCIHEAVELMGAFNLSDYVPILAPLDLQGLARRMKRVSNTADKILERIIDEHEESSSSSSSRAVNYNDQTPQTQSDFIHVLLSLMHNPDNKFSTSTHDDDIDDLSYSDIIDRNTIKAIVLDMIVGAQGSSSMTIEWIMTELLRHPRVMTKVQEEINNVVGQDRMVDEDDLSKFKYLEMVIKETLRFHPAAPLLVPRESMEDIVIDGYFIPYKSRILVNYWALSRDPNVWSDDAEEFIPERFGEEGAEIDIRGGRHFKFLPFGGGRRGCPGINLGMTTIRLVLAQLVHCFDWKLPHGMSPDDVDMTEKFGLAMPKATHLFAVPTYRLKM